MAYAISTVFGYLSVQQGMVVLSPRFLNGARVCFNRDPEAALRFASRESADAAAGFVLERWPSPAMQVMVVQLPDSVMDVFCDETTSEIPLVRRAAP